MRNGTWMMVYSDGKKTPVSNWVYGGAMAPHLLEEVITGEVMPHDGKQYKFVYGRPCSGSILEEMATNGERCEDSMPSVATRYNFATGMWCDDDYTRCEDYSENPG